MRRFRNSCFQEITEMPIYEYRCQSCGHEFETIQKLSDAPLTTCPACSEESLRKKVSAAGFRLKGGGWYETDFKAGKKKNVAGESGGGDSGSSSSSGGDGAGKSSSSGDGASSSATKSDGAKQSSGSSKPAAKSSD